jgi:histone deacetylase 11
MRTLHVVYDAAYNVESLGDVGTRYAATMAALKAQFAPEFLHVHAPIPFDVEDSHTAEYMERLKNPDTIRGIFESETLSDEAVDAVNVAQQWQYCGSLTAAEIALREGFAVNLGGGLHHASRDAGSGFCLYNDITAVVERLLETGRAQRILIVDLDAHQGNGYEADLMERCKSGQVCIFDAFEPMLFPFPVGEAVKPAIHYFIPYLKDDRGDVFIEYLLKGIELPFEEFRPDFVIYNAGTDPMEGDPVAGLGQTAEAIKDRDWIVVESCRRAGVPVMMCMSGGYGDGVPGVVAESLHQICSQQ